MKKHFLLLTILFGSFTVFAQQKNYLYLHGRGGTDANVTWGHVIQNLGLHNPAQGLTATPVNYNSLRNTNILIDSIANSKINMTNKIWMGFSQGGLISRGASQFGNSIGWVAVASPHRGAPIVDENQNNRVTNWATNLTMGMKYDSEKMDEGLQSSWLWRSIVEDIIIFYKNLFTYVGIILNPYSKKEFSMITSLFNHEQFDTQQKAISGFISILDAPELSKNNFGVNRLKQTAFTNLEPEYKLNIFAETTDDDWKYYSYASVFSAGNDLSSDQATAEASIQNMKDNISNISGIADWSDVTAWFISYSARMHARDLRSKLITSLHDWYLYSGNYYFQDCWNSIEIQDPGIPVGDGGPEPLIETYNRILSQQSKPNKLSKVSYPFTYTYTYTVLVPGRSDLVLPVSSTSFLVQNKFIDKNYGDSGYSYHELDPILQESGKVQNRRIGGKVNHTTVMRHERVTSLAESYINVTKGWPLLTNTPQP